MLLPAKPEQRRATTRAASSAGSSDADDGAGRLLAATVARRTGARRDPLYVHAKVGIVDDRWLTIGSANLNEHSLFNDTEMNVVTYDPELARATRLRLWAEHLELPAEDARRATARDVVDAAVAPDRRRAAPRLDDGRAARRTA